MSAIAGVVRLAGAPIDAQGVAQIAAAGAPRGKDGIATWHDGTAGLIRFRHATTPEAEHERQPRPAGSGDVMCFDGRLDNRLDLLTLLGAAGEKLRDAPDDEVAMALFEALGDDFMHVLVGDYAFAIWQPTRRRLFCARSPMGWRPFLFTADPQHFAFASEPRALIVGLGLAPRLNEGAIGEYLAARIVNRTETFWAGVERLPGGSAVVFERGMTRRWQWHDEGYEDLSHLSDDEHVECFSELFDRALIALTRSNGPVAAQLSGGLDSSSVLSRATELHRAGRIARQVMPITARYPGEAHDETEWSSLVEAHLGLQATVVTGPPFDPDAAAAWCAATLQLPLRPNSIGGWQEVVRQLERDGTRVVLTGEGGDDWMNGSRAHWPDLLRRGHIGTILREGLARGPDRSFFANVKSVASESVLPLVSAKRRARLIYPYGSAESEVPPWIGAAWAGRIALRERWRAVPRDVGGSFAQAQRRAQLRDGRPEMIWDPIRAVSEAHGVEMRHPLHDLRLIRFYIGAAGGMLQRGGVRRHVFREAMRGTLPESIRTRQSKAVFNTPIIDAVTTLYERRPLRDWGVVQRGWIEPEPIERAYLAHRAWREAGGTGPRPELSMHSFWFAAAVELWLEHSFRAAGGHS